MEWDNLCSPDRTFVVNSNAVEGASAPSVTQDSQDILWVAYKHCDGVTYSIRVKYSTDGGRTWQYSGQVFGTVSNYPDKYPALVAFNGKIGLMVSDDIYYKWYERNDNDGLTTSWTPELNIGLVEVSLLPMHFTLDVDSQGDVLFAHQKGNGDEKYCDRYHAGTWQPAELVAPAAPGNYPTIFVSADDSEWYLRTVDNDGIYLYTKVNDTWQMQQKLFSGTGSIRIGSFAVDRKIPNTIYIFWQEGDGKPHYKFGFGRYVW